jgi:LysR family hydrogen peroxide-inducible transcriptional activator
MSMNYSWMTLRDIEYLLAVAEHHHFGNAARAVHVSQPALSAQVRKFEERLGTQIFERSNKKVLITPLGELVLRAARGVVREAEAVLAAAHSHLEHRPLRGDFRLGAIATVGPYLLPRILSPLRKEFPEARLLLTEGLTDTLIHDLRKGALDAVIASPTFNAKGLKSFPLYFERFMLAIPKGHELAERPLIRAADLDPAQMVLLQDGHCLSDQAIGFCSFNRRGNIRQGQATSLETLRHLVATGIGYTLVPSLAVGMDRALKSLISYKDFEDEKIGRKISLYCREGYAKLSDAESLATFIQEQMKEP